MHPSRVAEVFSSVVVDADHMLQDAGERNAGRAFVK
jgi:hypothetical protein